MLSTRNVMLPVSSDVTFATRVGRCSSGNAVLGADVTLTRFTDGAVAVAMLEDFVGVDSLPDESKRLGTDGTAKVEDVSFTAFCALSVGVEMNVKGSIGYGVSRREPFSYRTTTGQHRKTQTIKKLDAILMKRFVGAISYVGFPTRSCCKGNQGSDRLPLLANFSFAAFRFPLYRKVESIG